MNSYELTVILRNKNTEALIERVKEILTKHGAVIVSDNSPGIKRMAYEVDKEKEGHYLYLNIETSPDSVKKIIGEFRINSDILRHLFVKVKKAATV